MSKGHFVISLDFELMWGVRDKRSIASYGENILGVRTVIPRLLDLFKKHNIKATFSTVGFLFFDNKNSLKAAIPSETPKYLNSVLNPYVDNFDYVGPTESEDIYHFGASLVSQIRDAGQDIGTHTFSHFYTLEPGASLAAFEVDIQTAKKVAENNGVSICSIVFPRNQYGSEHIDICKKNGIDIIRTNEASWLYKPHGSKGETLWLRVLRLLDSYINVSGQNTHALVDCFKENTLYVPSSRFLRPYSKMLFLFDFLKLNRIKNGMTHAALKNEIYHIWWHPHNFGSNIEKNFQFLEKIIDHYKYLNHTYGFRSSSMEDIRKIV